MESFWMPPGCLTGHKVRFNGMEGRAGTFHPVVDTYTVTLYEGYTRQLEVGSKYIEDLGFPQDDPIAKWEPKMRTVECESTFHIGMKDFKVMMSFIGTPICWRCKIPEAKARSRS